MKIRPLWEVCTKCNYNRHVCGGCGQELTHYEDEHLTHIREHHPEVLRTPPARTRTRLRAT